MVCKTGDYKDGDKYSITLYVLVALGVFHRIFTYICSLEPHNNPMGKQL